MSYYKPELPDYEMMTRIRFSLCRHILFLLHRLRLKDDKDLLPRRLKRKKLVKQKQIFSAASSTVSKIVTINIQKSSIPVTELNFFFSVNLCESSMYLRVTGN
jgi:hypothetical protein